jgi:hypothetical protein
LIFGGGFDGTSAPVPPDPVPEPTPTPVPVPAPGPVTVARRGKITQYPLPSVPHTALLPFTSNGASKQADMCYCPLNNRIYAQGGDGPIGSANDRTVSVDATLMTDWRLDVGKPVYPTTPAPHALQDDFGREWVEKRQQFLWWPGDYFAYDSGTNPPDPAVYPLLNYSCGHWWFDPVTNKYTQDRTLWPGYLVNPVGTGDPYGGVYDEVNDQIIVLGDDSSGYRCMRYDMVKLVRMPDIAYRIAPPVSNPAAKSTYFMRTQYTKIGRYVYAVGFATDGTGLKVPRFFRWGLDDHTMTELATPPVKGSLIDDKETQLNNSHGKVVWLFTNGPEGGLVQPDGTVAPLQIYVYDPATNSWAQDTQPLPADGSFMGNVTCSLPDGRVALAGGVFGRQQTRFNFYEAA